MTPAAPDPDASGQDGAAARGTPPGADRRLPRGYLLAVAVLAASLVLLALFWQHARGRELRAAQLEFMAESDEALERLRERMIQHELVLRGGVALFGTVAMPSRQQWKAYVDAIGIGERFPALVGLGYAPYLDPGELAQLQLRERTAGMGLYSIRPRGVRGEYGPILYLEPKTTENVDAVGFDMFSHPVRRQAMQAARDSGEAWLSGAVQLVQDGSADVPVRSVLMYAPVYRAGDSPRGPAARRLSMQGWVYAPIRIDRLVSAALDPRLGHVRVAIHDVTGDIDVPLYSDPASHATDPPQFRRSLLMRAYGRDWRVDFHSGPTALAVPRLASVRNNMVLGGLVALLLFGLALLLARTESRASQIAARMTENYRRSEQRFRNAMRYSAIGKALLDGEGRIVEANPALGDILGHEPSTLVGVRFHRFFLEDDGHASDGTEDIADGVVRTTRQLVHEDGQLRHAQLTFAPVPGKVGQDVARLVQVEDVTERLRAEARVHALNRTLESRVALRTRELSAANQELEAFAYSVSHDLRSPLRTIEGFSRLLLERHASQLDEAGRDYLGRVRKAAGRMGELIDSMLKMSRLSRSELRMATIDLSQLARDLARDLQADDPGRDVAIDIAPGLEACGDPVLVRSLLQNLLDNAWKFTRGRDGARIEVGPGEARHDGAKEFFVRDNGAGFPPEYADKLFRPFQRLHSQDSFAGHGIGLASAKRIVDRHGGSLRARGREGEGATFWFTLPGSMPGR
ncbi:MAG TPA: CHASE domain-containing protein [Xanthomonadaceae bacterium]|nr:CHASE domain-containing protein [Xanthomonadaceae bacterium]